jgi:hypothetical protein
VFISEMEIISSATCELRATATHTCPIVIRPKQPETSQTDRDSSFGISNMATSLPPPSFTNFDSQITQNFLALLESSTGMTFSDLCLRVGPDQREFPCHRVILATRSRWFNSMLLNGMQESNLRSISLPDTDPSIFEHVMRWIYSGSVDINALLAPEEASAVGTRLWKLWEARLLFT